MKTAVVFYSMSGNMEYVAEKIREKIADADLIGIKPVKAYPDKGFRKFLWGGKSAVMAEKPKLMPYSLDIGCYDSVVIGFPVWAGRFAPPIRTFVEENKDALKTKQISAYACQAGSGVEKALASLKDLLNIDGFKAEMVLTDPKEKKDMKDLRAIEEFSEKIG